MFLISFIGFTVSFFLIISFIQKKKKKMGVRINKFLPRTLEPTIISVEENNKAAAFNLKQTFINFSKKFKGKRYTNKWSQHLEEAGIPLKPEEFIVIRALLMVAAILIPFLFQLYILFYLLFFAISWFSPLIYLKSKRDKRINKSARQLPQALGTMATAMKSGFSFMQSMSLVAKEVPDPLGTEFERTLRDINYGISTEEAFNNLLSRLPNSDLKLVVTAVLIQRSTGGNLAQILETIEETITERVRIKEDLRTLTAQGRMSAWIISLLPVGLGFMLHLMSPDYFSPMLSHPLGWTLLGMGAVSGTIGWIVIQKIVRIEV